MIRLGTVLGLYLLNLPFADGAFVVLLTLPMLILVLIGLSRLTSPRFQVGDMFWFCLFIYFVLSPLQRLHGDRIGGVTAITAYAYERWEFVIAMLIVLIFTLPFLFVPMQRKEDGLAGSAGPGLLLLIGNVVAFALFSASEGGLERLLSPRLEQDPAQSFIASMLFLAAQSVTACLIAASFAASRHKLACFGALFVALVLLGVARNPFNAPRFVLLAVWAPALLALACDRLSAAKFHVACLLALTILFPILNITTRSGIEGLQDLSGISFVDNLFDIPSIDVFDTAVHAVRFMEGQDFLWGEKLAAVLLFFVPRALWPGKPIVGGLDIGNQLFAAGMYGTPNLSFFLGCDFYMDFGFVGVALGGVLTSLLLRLALKSDAGTFFGLPVLHFVIGSSLPILLRGPVGAVLPLFVCQVFVAMALGRMRRQEDRRAYLPAEGAGA
ncbi:hypothetical protein QTL95_09220 [Rhizobium sp. S152]|uniref:hypothetical protein n=1 Tax=Rhizobium sp. S152 TaxID=3055038 RepID=UPI0025A9DB1C|nr:hypothetical protein [Rhizobium sp. S152]MDM9626076.1 hypothetical protein [Rhizobium sp. S152]